MKGNRSIRQAILASYFTLTMLLLITGCASHVKYLAAYHPSEHKVVLVLLPNGHSGETLGKVLDRVEDPPYRIVSITEEECRLRADLSQLFDKSHRITPDIACALAKSVSATLVIFSERGGQERKRPNSDHDSDSGGEGGEGGEHHGRGEGGGYGGGHGGGFGGGGGRGHGGGGEGGRGRGAGGSSDSQFTILDARTSTVLWHETVSANPSDSDLQKFAKRLVTDAEPTPMKVNNSTR